MKKLILACVGLLFTILSLLSITHFSYEAVEGMESDKQTMIITKKRGIFKSRIFNRINRWDGAAPNGYPLSLC